jgi:hypothetical protein
MTKDRFISFGLGICLIVSGISLVTEIRPELKLISVAVIIVSSVWLSIIAYRLRNGAR